MPRWRVQVHRQVIYFGDIMIDADTEEEAQGQAEHAEHGAFEWYGNDSESDEIVVDDVLPAEDDEK